MSSCEHEERKQSRRQRIECRGEAVADNRLIPGEIGPLKEDKKIEQIMHKRCCGEDQEKLVSAQDLHEFCFH